MCDACWETPDGNGRRCNRQNGFSPVESDQRNRSRGLNNAADALASGDPQRAANQLANATRAQHDIDSAPTAPEGAPAETAGPARDFTINPACLNSANIQLDAINRERAARGQEPLDIEVHSNVAADATDPVRGWETTTVRITGASQDELDRVRLTGMSSDPEMRIRTLSVLAAGRSIMKADSGDAFISRADGGPDSTPARVVAYVQDAPNGQMRQRYAPDESNVVSAKNVVRWAGQLTPTNEYTQAMQNALAREYITPREVGTASGALAGYQRHMREMTAHIANNASKQMPAPERMAPAPPASRWLNAPGDKVRVTGRVEKRSVSNVPGHRYLSVLYVMRTKDGDRVKWITDDISLAEGDDITLFGTVKGHGEFHGEKETEMYYTKAQAHQGMN